MLNHRKYFNPLPPFRAIVALEVGLKMNLFYSVGDLRLRVPEPFPAYTGAINATAFGFSCPQQTSADDTAPLLVLPPETLLALQQLRDLAGSSEPPEESEDCASSHWSPMHRVSHELSRSDHQCFQTRQRHRRFQSTSCCCESYFLPLQYVLCSDNQ